MEPVGAGSIMAPLNRLLEATRRVEDGNLSKRIATTGSSDNELDQLAGSFNHMAARVEMTQSAPAARNQVLEQQQVERSIPAGSTIYILFTFIYLTALYPSFMIDEE